MEDQIENVSVNNQEVEYYSPIELKDSEDFYNQVDENQQKFKVFWRFFTTYTTWKRFCETVPPSIGWRRFKFQLFEKFSDFTLEFLFT